MASNFQPPRPWPLELHRLAFLAIGPAVTCSNPPGRAAQLYSKNSGETMAFYPCWAGQIYAREGTFDFMTLHGESLALIYWARNRFVN